VLRDCQVDVAARSVDRCLGVGEACSGLRPILGSFGQGHPGSGDEGNRPGAISE